MRKGSCTQSREFNCNQGFVGAHAHAAWHLTVEAAVALDHLVGCLISLDGAERADQHAGTALNAALGFNEDQSRRLVAMHGSGQAGIDAWSRIAVTAADREALVPVLFDPDAAGRWRGPVFERLERVVIAGVVGVAKDAAEPTCDAEFLFDTYSCCH